LSESGFVEGRNVAIEFRWARSQYDRPPALVAELVARQVTVLVGLAEIIRHRSEAGDINDPNRLWDGRRSGVIRGSGDGVKG
jgi:hypothetical protein